MDISTIDLTRLSLPLRLALFASVALATHLLVVVVRHYASALLSRNSPRRYQKLRSVATLTTSAIVFSLYFFAVGLILREFGVSLTAYLASASVAGLAIGFGSQGVVQDVVTGLTLIFSDLVDVDDLVEIAGQTGFVKAITMRFVELENALAATVFIPNRTINNIVSYPRGYVRCVVDIALIGDQPARQDIQDYAVELMRTTYEQFPGISLAEPSLEGRFALHGGKEILRLKFRIWPDRGGPIETNFAQELLAVLQSKNADYQAWMITVGYEIEVRKARRKDMWPWRAVTPALERRN
ncbi:MAG: mechanosensitive ion channel [Pseudomonadales bacterium]|nr:mechanosensitive ion channel [Pseudomonadales bacterium]